MYFCSNIILVINRYKLIITCVVMYPYHGQKGEGGEWLGKISFSYSGRKTVNLSLGHRTMKCKITLIEERTCSNLGVAAVALVLIINTINPN